MTCFYCKGDIENKNTNFVADFDTCIIIIKNVPSQVCRQCGEVSYSLEVSKHLERIIESVRSVVSDIAVLEYKESA